jgi:hypothetical protein
VKILRVWVEQCFKLTREYGREGPMNYTKTAIAGTLDSASSEVGQAIWPRLAPARDLVGGGAGRDSSRMDARHRRVHGFDDGLAVLSLAVLAGVTRSPFKLIGVVL